jgi:hypothetical protein
VTWRGVCLCVSDQQGVLTRVLPLSVTVGLGVGGAVVTSGSYGRPSYSCDGPPLMGGCVSHTHCVTHGVYLWRMGFIRERGLTLLVRGARSESNPYFFCIHLSNYNSYQLSITDTRNLINSWLIRRWSCQQLVNNKNSLWKLINKDFIDSW